MTFNFDPMTDEEINAHQNRALLAKGVYPFKVTAAEYGLSEAGNKMMKLKLTIFEADGSQRNIFDNLIAIKSMMFKTKHFCDTTGLSEKYAMGDFSISDCLNRSGMVEIVIQKGNVKKDGSGFYPDKNVVRDYVKASDVPSKDSIKQDIKF